MCFPLNVEQAAVASKNYKEAGHVSRQIKETERRQETVRRSTLDIFLYFYISILLLGYYLGTIILWYVDVSSAAVRCWTWFFIFRKKLSKYIVRYHSVARSPSSVGFLSACLFNVCGIEYRTVVCNIYDNTMCFDQLNCDHVLPHNKGTAHTVRLVVLMMVC